MTLEPLLKAKGQFKPLKKNGNNPHFRSKYSTFEDVCNSIDDAFQANGLIHGSLCWANDHGINYLKVFIADKDGTMLLTSDWPIICKDPNDPQKFGAAATYAERFGLSKMLGIACDVDDDGNVAAQPAAKVDLNKQAAGYLKSISGLMPKDPKHGEFIADMSDKLEKGYKLTEKQVSYLKALAGNIPDRFNNKDEPATPEENTI